MVGSPLCRLLEQWLLFAPGFLLALKSGIGIREYIFTAIKASSNERIWDLATFQMIVGLLETQAVLVCLHADASETTWGKSSQLSKMRVTISTGIESRGESFSEAETAFSPLCD